LEGFPTELPTVDGGSTAHVDTSCIFQVVERRSKPLNTIKMNEQISIIVLGMHRSGTSALTGCLNILGVNLGERLERLMSAHEDNPKGYWENEKVISINEAIFLRWVILGTMNAHYRLIG